MEISFTTDAEKEKGKLMAWFTSVFSVISVAKRFFEDNSVIEMDAK